MAGNLTQDEARERGRLLSVESYEVHVDLTGGPDTFRSTTVVRFTWNTEPGPGTATFAELADADVHEAVLNGVPLPAGSVRDGRIALTGLAAVNELRVVADCRYSRTGEGLHRFTDPADDRTYLYSQFATADAQRVFACFDQPDLKARLELTVTAPDGWEVLSNSAVDEPVPGPSGTVWHFPPTEPLPTYALALVAGPYHVAHDEYRAEDGRVVPLRALCRASLAEHLDADVVFDITKRGFGFLQGLFATPYPFTKYDQIFAPEFNVGAMENAACVTVNEKYVFRSRPTALLRERRAETLLHELAHMWFGDLVTMRWWDDLWLNESFATYAGVLAQSEVTEWTGAWATFAALRKAEAYRQDQLPSTHPIAADIPDIAATEVNFDGITYLKGASVLKQLVAYVGRDNFEAAIRTYIRRHAWGSTTLADLLRALEETSGRDLAAWSQEWLETSGVNTLHAEYETDADGRITRCTVVQAAPESSPVLRSHRMAIGLYDRGPDGITRRHRVETDVTGARTDVPALVGERLPELLLLNDDDLTYAKVRLDERSLRTVLGGIGEIRDPLAAAQVWTIAWNMTRDALLPARDYVALVVSGLGSVTDATLAQTLLDQARKAVHDYADPAWRDTGLEILAEAAHGLLRTAEPGSELQLVYAQAFLQAAASPAHLRVLRDILDGNAGFPGLEADADLRWALLRRLVARGAAGPDDIDTELRGDRSAAGVRNAVVCRAALPTPEAKEAAWQRMLAADLPNSLLRANLEGFTEPDHRDLLEPFADRYFAEVRRMWAERPGGNAQRFAREAFPAGAVSERTLASADAAASADGVPAALRRLLVEGRDEVARAVRARRCDARSSTTTLV
ncbi:aminopeptidase N [Streptomyces hiroshimensis]|uniref:Aminopeptidase N n=1 Tax=Streptomyces hiroshimensis TaxID=66424 RepID=A0ABQ2YRU6_9ACTN|nr:aminopeptidase N [Streptomyces hiroshimensis]GGX91946.1 aminopeptidase N [Streptomyces hiroshimensis]